MSGRKLFRSNQRAPTNPLLLLLAVLLASIPSASSASHAEPPTVHETIGDWFADMFKPSPEDLLAAQQAEQRKLMSDRLHRLRNRTRSLVFGAAKAGIGGVTLSTVISACRRSRYFQRKVVPTVSRSANSMCRVVFRVGDWVIDTAQSWFPFLKGDQFHKFDMYEGTPFREREKRKAANWHRNRRRSYNGDNNAEEGEIGEKREEQVEKSFFGAMADHVRSKMEDSWYTAKDNLSYAWREMAKFFSDDAFFDHLQAMESSVEVLRKIYTTFPPKKKHAGLPPEAFTSHIHKSRRMQKEILKRALVHYHPDRNSAKKYGRRWNERCKKITDILLRHYSRFENY